MEQRTILVVDDDQGLRELIRISLEHEGYTVIQAANGLECVSAVREQQPDLVLLDVMMPEMDGLEACSRLREFSRVPVLMLTARVQSADIVTGLDKGADDYLVKPFSPEELRARLANLIEVKRTRELLQRELTSQSHDLAGLAHEAARYLAFADFWYYSRSHCQYSESRSTLW